MKKVRNRTTVPKATRIFTDREEPRASFWKMYEKARVERIAGADDIHVLTYYGIGGIGKSSLLDKLMAEMDEKLTTARYLYFDFKVQQESRVVLEKMRTKLVDDYQYTFPLFDLANYVYAKKIGEKTETPETKKLSERSPLLSSMMELAGSIPVIGIAAQVLSLADQCQATIRSYLKQHSRELAQIEYLEAEELYQQLPVLFAEDMSRNLENEYAPFVFFLDTYERLVNELSQVGEPLKNDYWIREELGLVQNIPGVLWVIAGREKLRWERFDSEWEDSLEQHILGNLSEVDSEHFLVQAGIGSAELRADLYKLTDGTPVYLDLCVAQHQQILSRGEIPTADMFGKDTQDLIERFLRYMDNAQKDMVFMLCCLKQWSDELIAQIGGKILPNFSLYAYEKVKDFSFIIQSEENLYNIHQTIGSVLINECPRILKDRTADCLIERFCKDLSQDTPEEDFLTAANYMLEAGIMKYRDSEALREFYEENLRSAVAGLSEAGRFDQAEMYLNRLASVAERDTKSRLKAMYLLDKSRVAFDRGIRDPEAKLAFQAYEMYADLLGEDHSDSLWALGHLAACLAEGIDIKRALEMERRIYEKRLQYHGANDPATVLAMLNYSISLSAAGEYRQALELMEETYHRSMQIHGPDDANTILAMQNYAVALKHAEQWDSVLELERQVLDWRKENLGDTHPNTLAAQQNYAVTLRQAGDLAQCLELEKEVLCHCREILGDNHPDTLAAMNNYALTLEAAGEEAEALALMEEAIERRMQILGEDHPDTLTARINYAATLSRNDECERALDIEKDVLQRRIQILGKNHPDTLSAMYNCSISMRKLGEYEEALALAKEVLTLRTDILGADHPATIDSMFELANICWRTGDKQRSRQLEEEGLAKRMELLGPEHPDTLTGMFNLSITLEDFGELERCLELREQVFRSRSEMLGEDHPDTIDALVALANVHWAIGNKEKTAEIEKKALELYRSCYGDEDIDTLHAAYNLSVTLTELEQWEDAEALLRWLVSMYTELFGNDHPDTLQMMEQLQELEVQMAE